jgi:uncharacterized protein YutE (UPF0331/DUF86 family)
MVDPERLLGLLGRITARAAVLEPYADADRGDLMADEVRMGHLKYTFLTALEACLDAAHHVAADRGLGMPATNADTFRLLGQAGIIEQDLAELMAGASGFRNVLIHDYAEVDDSRVVDNLARLGDLRRFVAALTRLLDEAEA